MSSFSIGVDLGGTNLRIAAVDLDGNLLEKVTTGTQVSKGREFVVGEMTDAIKTLATKFGRSGELVGVGIGVPGIIDKRTGMLRESPNLPGWDDYPVRDEIEKRLSTPVILENDANVAAFGEGWLGAARGYSEVCMITLGTGVGGGLVLAGRIWQGMNGMAGEVGHVTIEPDGHPCGCGNRGCAEQYASATAIVRMAKEEIAAGNAPELEKMAAGPNVEFTSRAVFNLALQGDAAAQRVYDRVGRALGILIGDLINIMNLRMYVIGGGVSNGWQAFAPRMFQELRGRSMVYAATAPPDECIPVGAASKVASKQPPPYRTVVTRALLGSDAGLYGAARLPLAAAAK
ncbi:MAG TPA: ROK family protein [Terriglobales bacterium]|nr:ROK family protein [Terriglobales bacterium]